MLKHSIAARAAAALALAALVAPAFAHAAVPPTARGRILLDVGRKGEAWYVDPVSESKAYLANGEAAYSMLRTYGLGITSADLALIPVGVSVEELSLLDDVDSDDIADDLEQALGTDPARKDTDDDGFSDKEEITGGFDPLSKEKPRVDLGLTNRLAGRILIQVQGRGQAWYVHPVNKKRYYMRDGAAAYQVMHDFGLGATSADIDAIAASRAQVDCGVDMACLATSIENKQAAYVVGGAPDPLSTEEVNEGAISLMETFWNVATDKQVFLLTSYDSTDLKAPAVTAVMACDVGDDAVLPGAVRDWGKNEFGGASRDADGNIGGDLNTLANCARYLPSEAGEHGAGTAHPSVVPNTLAKLAEARAWARDSGRIATVKALQTSLDLYLATEKAYPLGSQLALGSETSACLGAAGFAATCDNNAGTVYQSKITAAGTPADGACTEAQNVITYTASADRKDYTISYCLGAAIGTSTAGPHTAKPGKLE